jgi:hypothetical protein
MAHIRIRVNTGFVGAVHWDECEVPDDWDEMTEEERQAHLSEVVKEAVWNYIEAYAEYVED